MTAIVGDVATMRHDANTLTEGSPNRRTNPEDKGVEPKEGPALDADEEEESQKDLSLNPMLADMHRAQATSTKGQVGKSLTNRSSDRKMSQSRKVVNDSSGSDVDMTGIPCYDDSSVTEISKIPFRVSVRVPHLVYQGDGLEWDAGNPNIRDVASGLNRVGGPPVPRALCAETDARLTTAQPYRLVQTNTESCVEGFPRTNRGDSPHA